MSGPFLLRCVTACVLAVCLNSARSGHAKPDPGPTQSGHTPAGRKQNRGSGKPSLYIIGPGLPLQTVVEEQVTDREKVFDVVRGKQTGQELFRVHIGVPHLTWWRHGVTGEADINLDGKTDYGWYGGDDTSEVMYAFISSRRGYRKVDVILTFQRAWTRQRPDEKPLTDAHLTSGDQLRDIELTRDSHGICLQGVVDRSMQRGEPRSYPIAVHEPDFVYTERLD